MTNDVPPDYLDRPPRFKDAEELVSVGLDVHGREAFLLPPAADEWRRMVRAASVCGAALVVVSAFRSIERQREIVTRKREKGMTWETILRVSAYPGFSEHHTGCAIDIGSPTCHDLAERFETTEEFRWLSEHANGFGFAMSYPRGNRFGVTYEPWHWMWTKVSAD